jgi:uncharacterized membrane protein YdbT with pleckstrin-like domain
MAKKTKVPKKTYLWHDRKRNFLGLPWTFTKYCLDQDRLFINTGIFNTTEDEVRLYRITDITLKRSFWQRLIRTGTIHCDSSDATQKNFDIKNVKHPKEVKDMLSKLVDESRLRNRVYTSESVTPDPHSHQRENENGHGHGREPEGELIPPPEIDMTDANGNNVPDVFER